MNTLSLKEQIKELWAKIRGKEDRIRELEHQKQKLLEVLGHAAITTIELKKIVDEPREWEKWGKMK